MSPSRLPSCPVSRYSLANALGLDTQTALARISEGQCGLSPTGAELPFATHEGRIAEALPELPAQLSAFEARVSRIAWAALEPLLSAVRDVAGRVGAERVAVVVGSSTGGIAESERAYARHARGEPLPPGYSFVSHHAFGGLVEMVVLATGARGPAYAVSTACASSAKVFGSAQRLLATGMADAVLVGGADSLCQTTLRGFAGLKVLSALPCRPFDKNRAGISIGEGAAFVLLERGANARLHLLSVGETSDAHHMTAPHPEGLGAVGAMVAALEGAGLRPSDVGYVNAHGTGTDSNDAAEARALCDVFGPDVPVSSTKGMTGHLLGAAGATEAVLCLDALERGRLPRNVGCEEPEAEARIHIVRETESRQVEVALSNSFAFGGCNASVVFGRQPTAFPGPPERTVEVAGVALWAPGCPSAEAFLEGATFEGGAEPPAALLPTRARGRASLLTRLAAEIVGQLATGSQGAVDAGRIPVVFGSAFGEMGTTLGLLHALSEGEALLSPLRFPGSVHNAALGALSIQTGNRGFSTALSAGELTPAMTLVEALAWLGAHGGEALVVLAEEGAPAPFWRGVGYGPLAYGFWLATTTAPGSDPTRPVLRVASGAPDGGEVATLSRRPEHPLRGGLDLLEAAARRVSRRAWLTTGAATDWHFDLSFPTTR